MEPIRRRGGKLLPLLLGISLVFPAAGAFAERPLAVVEKEAQAADPFIREKALIELTRRNDFRENVRCIESLCRAVSDPEPRIRILVLEKLKAFAEKGYYNKFVLPGLLTGLRDGMTAPRRVAVRGLEKAVYSEDVAMDPARNEEVIAALLACLEEARGLGPEAFEVRGEMPFHVLIFEAFPPWSDPRIIAVLRRGLENPDPEIVRRALRGLTTRVPLDRRFAEQVRPLLGHPDRRVRCEAVITLGMIDLNEDLPRLERIMASDPDGFVRGDAAAAIGWMRRPEALPALRAALADPEPYVKWKAAKALGAMHDTASRGVLERLKIDPLLAGEIEDALKWLDVKWEYRPWWKLQRLPFPPAPPQPATSEVPRSPAKTTVSRSSGSSGSSAPQNLSP